MISVRTTKYTAPFSPCCFLLPLVVRRWGRNPRGVSYTFGHDVIEEFLTRHDLDLICRAHQVKRKEADKRPSGGVWFVVDVCCCTLPIPYFLMLLLSVMPARYRNARSLHACSCLRVFFRTTAGVSVPSVGFLVTVSCLLESLGFSYFPPALAPPISRVGETNYSPAPAGR